MYKKAKPPERAKIAMDFFTWVLHDGQKLAQELDYVPLPATLVQQIDGYWHAQFQGNGG
jgi:phosphate transport system substrate-binding protein